MTDRYATELLNLRRLPARLNGEQAAHILGFRSHDVAALIASKLLKPIGKPAENAVKYFVAAEIENLANQPKWLDDATYAVYRYWEKKNRRRRTKAAAFGEVVEIAA
jgi:hypothetical protein